MEAVVVHRERRTEVGDRLVHESELELRLAEVLQDTDVPRLQHGGTLELDDRGGVLTGVQQRRPQPELDEKPARTERVRAPKALERLGEPPLPHEFGAELELVIARHVWSIAAPYCGARTLHWMARDDLDALLDDFRGAIDEVERLATEATAKLLGAGSDLALMQLVEAAGDVGAMGRDLAVSARQAYDASRAETERVLAALPSTGAPTAWTFAIQPPELERFRVEVKAWFFFVRALCDNAYRVLLARAEDTPAPKSGSMTKAAGNPKNPVAILLSERTPTFWVGSSAFATSGRDQVWRELQHHRAGGPGVGVVFSTFTAARGMDVPICRASRGRLGRHSRAAGSSGSSHPGTQTPSPPRESWPSRRAARDGRPHVAPRTERGWLRTPTGGKSAHRGAALGERQQEHLVASSRRSVDRPRPRARRASRCRDGGASGFLQVGEPILDQSGCSSRSSTIPSVSLGPGCTRHWPGAVGPIRCSGITSLSISSSSHRRPHVSQFHSRSWSSSRPGIQTPGRGRLRRRARHARARLAPHFPEREPAAGSHTSERKAQRVARARSAPASAKRAKRASGRAGIEPGTSRV